MSRRSKVFKPKKEAVICPKCGARLRISYYSNCAEYECSKCDYVDTIWEKLKVKKIRGPSKPKPSSKEDVLEQKDIRKIKKVIKNLEERFVFIVMLCTGLRKSEFIHMRKDWVNFKRNQIIIPKKQKCNCGQCKIHRRDLAVEDYESLNEHKKLIMDGYWVPKTKTSARTIAFAPEAREVLLKFFKKHKAALEVYLWASYTNNITDRLEKRSKVRVYPHCLRATFATRLALDGWDAYKLTEIMGWTSIDVARSYISVSGTELSKEMEAKWSPLPT